MTEIDIAKKALANAQDAYAETQSPETLDFIQRTQADLNRLYGDGYCYRRRPDSPIQRDNVRTRGDSHEPLRGSLHRKARPQRREAQADP
jgi:hypothetical protein